MITRAIRNNNPLNIRKGNNWKGLRDFPTDKELCEFQNTQYGFRAAFKILFHYIKCGYDTPREIIFRWAPPSENNSNAYLRFILDRHFVSENYNIKATDRYVLEHLVQAMAYYESCKWFPIEEIQRAYDFAVSS